MGALDKFAGIMPGSGIDITTTTFLYQIGIIVFSIIGLALAVYFVMIQLQYKYKVIVLEEQSDGGTMIHYTKGRIKKRHDGTEIFTLRNNKKAALPIPPLSAMQITAKGNKVVFMKKIGLGDYDYYPMGISLRGLQVYLTPFIVGRKNWISTELKRTVHKYGSVWDQYGSAIITGGVMVMALLMLIIIFKMNQTTAQLMHDAMNSVAGAISDMSVQKISEPVVPPGIGG